MADEQNISFEDIKKLVKTYKPAPLGTAKKTKIYNKLMEEVVNEFDAEG